VGLQAANQNINFVAGKKKWRQKNNIKQSQRETKRVVKLVLWSVEGCRQESQRDVVYFG
jgi:hypothetical protein